MASSGVEVDKEAKDKFEEVKMKKKHRYVTMKVDGNCVKVDKERKREEEVAEQSDEKPLKHLSATLSATKEPRFCVLDHEVTNKSGDGRSKDCLFLLQYIPDDCNVKQKMLYASTADAVKKVITNCKVVQISDIDELTESTLQEAYEK